ncbi:MarR family transcriptional regulator [Roseovarius sp. CAU 1744]|uniref:MarR family winged helix-turn-helix transcriptional regulator n=1 Tax=Roseovarius sp. CAU 1744 TaxID=3140368 RepID=UPI00325C1223
MPSETAVKTWINLARAYGTAMTEINEALAANGLPPLIWYDILLELERAGDDGLRPYELEHALLLKQYRVSRLVDRIARDGYLRRQSCDDDRRGKRLVITDEGRALRRSMWQIYGAKIHALVGHKLSDAQSRKLAALLAELTG